MDNNDGEHENQTPTDNAREYDFFEQLSMSEGVAQSDDIHALLVTLFPGAVSVEKASRNADRRGTDNWIVRMNGRALSVDMKVRKDDWSKHKYEPRDDLALETWSVIPDGRPGKVGWTRDSNKQTDFIVWFWKSSHRWFMLSFPLLCKIFIERWREWVDTYKNDVEQQYTPNFGGYHSECVFVPRAVVLQAIQDGSSGGLPVQLGLF